MRRLLIAAAIVPLFCGAAMAQSGRGGSGRDASSATEELARSNAAGEWLALAHPVQGDPQIVLPSKTKHLTGFAVAARAIKADDEIRMVLAMTSVRIA